ncbi:hypothetical protein FAZ15_22275 [Sphingobacterium olei]|uniref:HEAT repeat domain-containing protein n=1 Tax=Sphingobacterium olei TaxID=2571155 RepID=A0A4U0N751_9SPHI|nr:hypothetical protein [Sphingobacterium olei]TJZ49426.1 hypothetical protein FAZ15_22275 [Sphingobacterium olei]
MKYQDFNYSDKMEIIRLLSDKRDEVRSSAIVGMVNGVSDVEWVQDKLLELVDDKSFWVAKSAITGLGDLARIHGRLNYKKIQNAFKQITREELQAPLKDTLDDFRIFSSWGTEKS